MRESLMYGSVRGARGNSRPYRDEFLLRCMSPLVADFVAKVFLYRSSQSFILPRRGHYVQDTHDIALRLYCG